MREGRRSALYYRHCPNVGRFCIVSFFCCFVVNLPDWLPTLLGIATNHEWTGSYEPSPMDGVDFYYPMIGNLNSTRTDIAHYADKYGYVSVQIGNYKYTKAEEQADFADVKVHLYAGTREGGG